MNDSGDAPDGFLSRWARRKALVRQGDALPGPVAVPLVPPPMETAAEVSPQAHAAPAPIAAEPAPPPTLEEVAQLGRGSDFRRFVGGDVDPEVKNAALKKLFADPHFNVMDGLDTYIDDYGKPDPLPASMLRQMVQSRALGLFADEETVAEPPAAAAAAVTPDGAPSAGAAQSPLTP